MIRTKTTRKKTSKNGYFEKVITDEERFWTNKLKAVIYVRVSSDGQVTQWHGLESQESVCRDWCKKQNDLDVQVVGVFREEGVSGKLMDRKAMNKAIHFLEKENKKYTKIHYFVVTDADRIARPDDIAEAFTLEQKIESLGVKIVTVNNRRDTETDEWKFLHTIQYAIAGLERRKILRRTMNGRLSSLKNGGWPFPKPPLGYLREKGTEKSWYIDVLDTIKWPVIKEGLELYAYNPLFTWGQLYNYRISNGLKPNEGSKRLYFSFLEKTLMDYRLYFYAGYIYYPERGVNELIKWKHEALISLETAQAILHKESAKVKKHKWPNLDENMEVHFLRGMITCHSCGRRLGCHPSKWNGGVYYYYTCTNKYCGDRINVGKKMAESQFEEFIAKMTMPKPMFAIFRKYLLKEWKENRHRLSDSQPQIQGQLLSIKTKMEKIEEKILTIGNELLLQKLEQERAALEALQEDLRYKINDQQNQEENFEDLLEQAECLFTDPVKMWKNSDYEIRQLLSMVRFGGILFYKKNVGYRTSETTGLHYLFSKFWGGNYYVTTQGGTNSNPFSLSREDFELLVSSLIAQSKYINAIHKVKQIRSSSR